MEKQASLFVNKDYHFGDPSVTVGCGAATLLLRQLP
jgi:hypothetical protein